MPLATSATIGFRRRATRDEHLLQPKDAIGNTMDEPATAQGDVVACGAGCVTGQAGSIQAGRSLPHWAWALPLACA